VGISQEAFEWLCGPLMDAWGTGASLPLFGASEADNAALRALWAKAERASAPPGTMRALWETTDALDFRDILPAIRVPTLVVCRAGEPQAPASEYLAAHIPGARLAVLDGVDHYPWFGDADAWLDEVEEFLTGHRPVIRPDRVLATVVFTDIVDSTARAAELGDKAWRELLDRHDALVTRALERHRGRKVNPTGDGVLAIFDGPARAVQCATAIRDGVAELGLQARAGAHTGEIELRGDDIGGIAVHIGARVAGLAGPGDVFVSRTVTDLVAGSGIVFQDRGERELKGVPGSWRVFAVDTES
jgi:class 3 adenylate cyclase